MNVCVGALAAASDGVGISPRPMVGMSGAAAGVIEASGPFTQQHAGRSSSDKRTVEIDVRIAIGFHGSSRRTRMSGSRKVPGRGSYVTQNTLLTGAFATPALTSRIIAKH